MNCFKNLSALRGLVPPKFSFQAFVFELEVVLIV